MPTAFSSAISVTSRPWKPLKENLQGACRLMEENTSLEFIAEELKAAVNQLDAITGRNIDEDLLDRIFSEFCIGK